MSESGDLAHERLLDVEGPAAPPRTNGELVFRAPWESRIFGLTLVLHSQGRFEWDEFRGHLISAIARAERELGRDESHPYYACWFQALEHLLAAKSLCAPEALHARERVLAERPAGHDHLPRERS